MPLSNPYKKIAAAFAYTRTVIRAYANGRLGVRERLFGRTQTVITRHFTPIPSALISQNGRIKSKQGGVVKAQQGHIF